MNEFRRAFPWSDVRNIVAYPTRKKIGDLSFKELARCYAALLADMVTIKQRLDAEGRK